MTRTNIDLDDELVSEVMRRYAVSTKKEAVDLALRRLVGMPLTADFFDAIRGIGWSEDLDDLRSGDESGDDRDFDELAKVTTLKVHH
jgi:Arc/MetJ family transcription regulator